MTPTHAAGEPAFLHGLIHDRLTNLWAARQLYRKIAHHAEWTVARWECEFELRALLRLARQARRAAEEAAATDEAWRTVMLTRPEQSDPITRYKALVAAAETPLELAYANGDR